MDTLEQIEAELAEPCWWCDGNKTFGDYWCAMCGGSGQLKTRVEDRWYTKLNLENPAPYLKYANEG